ncbi:heparinase [Pedobacter sp. KBW06]|uniref:heparin-sulfate lyase HepC n=1 Tax=Pedobacter sp. KBW06 TaxID=2153359 RepID=UPI000F59B970|nr:heparin-sulfate lyase HepC [Pedobacter sp. KBW06]RQO69809.1 heparinase [Pedobacter sp. KBW06]
MANLIHLKRIVLLSILILCTHRIYAQEAVITQRSFEHINLSFPGLEKTNQLFLAGKYDDAAAELLKYYRNRNIRHPDFNIGDRAKYAGKKLSKDILEMADNALLHKLKPHKAYPYFDYGTAINWQYAPVPDALIRTFLHRTNWWQQMGLAYWSTGDEKYAKEWVFQVRDWIKSNQPGAYPDDKEFAWKAFVVSFRLNNWSGYFNMFLQSPNFTPTFLMEFLNSYQQQATYVKANYTDIGNHLLFEALHMMYAGATFPELKASGEWRKSGIEVLNKEITKQVYPDGMQYELSTSYHIGTINIFRNALEIAQLANLESEFPASYRELIGKMVLAVTNFSFPDYTFPLYGNSFLTNKNTMLKNYSNWSKTFPQNKVIEYFANDAKKGTIPPYLSKSLPDAGFYTFRNGWDQNATVMVLKASPPAFFHAHPDNGTFELWVKGRNFSPDAGSYVYNDDAKTNNKKDWYRSTKAHQTLTMDNKNMLITKAVPEKWETGKDLDLLSYSNPSYENLRHQRSVLFIDKSYFVIIDRAIGTATGNPAIHYALKEDSKPVFDYKQNRINTRYPDGNNLLIQLLDQDPVLLKEEQSFVSYQYQQEIARPAFVFEKSKPDGNTQSFISILYPYHGNARPDIRMKENSGHDPAHGKINMTITIDGKTKLIQQDLNP